jgi:sugar (pentulose or hexulose) kinase
MPGSPLLVGVDVGTTSVKACVMTTEGRPVAVGHVPTPWASGPDGVVTHAEAIASAARNALAAALDGAPPGRVLGVGVASMAESGVLVDASDSPVGPVIAWHDQRDVDDLADLVEDLGAERFSAVTGLPLWTQWSLTKYRWLTRHVPEVTKAVRRYNIAEWVVRSLGGAPVSEFSLTSRTGWLCLEEASVCEDTLAWSGAPQRLIGNLVLAGTPVGKVPPTDPIVRLRGAVLTVAGHDHQAAAIGVGACDRGDELDSCGTAEALVRAVSPDLPPDAVSRLVALGATVGWHAAAGSWCVLGATQAGLVLQKVLAALGMGRDDVPRLDEAAATAPRDASTVTISNAHDVRIEGSARPADVWAAAVDTVTADVARLSGAITEVTGRRGRLVVTGGWSNSRALMSAKTRHFGELWRSDVAEAGCRGAGLLAGLAAGVYPGIPDFPSAPITGFSPSASLQP